MAEGTTQTADAHSKEECLREEAWLNDDANGPKLITDAESISERHTCPVCGRKYDYVFTKTGMWDYQAEEYVK